MLTPPGRRWWWLVAAAASCTVLYLAASLGGAEIAIVGAAGHGKSLSTYRIAVWAAVPAVLVMAALAYATVMLSVQFARLAGGPLGQMIALGRSRRVPLAVGVHLAVLFIGVPVLAALGKALGASGTTEVHLRHHGAGYALLIAWLAILIAPWMEETAIRGFLLEGLWRRFGFWPAAVVSALVWSALHGVSGVLLPFLALGVSFAFVRKLTGTTRTGIALHGAQNTLASLVGGAGVFAVPPLILLVASLWITRPGAADALSRWVREAVASGATLTRAVAARAGRLPHAPPVLWSVAAVFSGGLVLAGLPSVVHSDTHSTALTVARIGGALLVAPLHAWLLATSRRDWGASAYTASAGLAGAILAIAGRLADWPQILPLGDVLISIGIFGLALALPPGRARAAAWAGAFLEAALLAPLPYLVTGKHGFLVQEWVVSAALVVSLFVLGLALRRQQMVNEAASARVVS